MAVDVAGVIVILVLYVIIVIVGVLAAKKYKPQDGATEMDVAMVAGRNLSLGVGMVTMTATFVGGGYINGTAEGVAKDGIAWTLTPFGIFIGTSLAGIFYAPPMRRRRYLTMLDPLQERYGDVMTGFLFLGAITADLFWAASILSALGTSLSVVIGVPVPAAIVVSAAVGVAYTFFGQMVAVAYTDILQLILMAFGLVLTVPFAATHPAVEDLGVTSSKWLGTIMASQTLPWIDFAIVQVFGSIPWQTYFQRVLSTKSVSHARFISIIGGFGGLLLGIPPMMVGAIGVSTNWNATDLGSSPIGTPDVAKILPLVFRYLTPTPVAIIGLSAVVAAVMSSLDSIVLSSSSMFTQNVYRMILRREASQRELTIVQRLTLLVAAGVATSMSIFMTSIFDMFYLAADIAFIVMLPQLTLSLMTPKVNAYGCACGLFLGLFLRLAGGDPALGIPVLICYPFYSETDGQIFPFKTFSMLCAFFSNLLVSLLLHELFSRDLLPARLDVANIKQKRWKLDNSDAGYEKSEEIAHQFTSSSIALTKF